MPSTHITTLSLHDALPISGCRGGGPPRLPQIRTCAINASGSSSRGFACATAHRMDGNRRRQRVDPQRSEEHTSELQSHSDLVCRLLLEKKKKQHPNPVFIA